MAIEHPAEVEPGDPREPAAAVSPRAQRFEALDLMRGLVMVLMTIDHASAAFNGGRLFSDSAFMWKPGSPLPADQFLTRWITHLCAPTFVFLAGAALSLSVARRVAAGAPAREIDRHVLVRGLVLVAIELMWMSPAMVGPGRVLLQVLFALGASLAAMACLRRLSDRWLAALGLLLLVGGEALVGLAQLLGVIDSVPTALVLSGGQFFERRLLVAYPVLPWLGMMCLGWVFGRRLRAAPVAPTRQLLLVGLAALAIFVVVRAANGYGNMRLYREAGSLLHWLHVSKYPPSLSYAALELGLMALLLALGFGLARRGVPGWAGPLRTLGQVALFYYVLHLHLLEGAAWALGLQHRLGVGSSYLAAAVALVVLFPACARYRRYKLAHPGGWTRYL